MFSHKQNLENKINNDYKSQRKFFEVFYNNHYLPWHQSNISIKGISKVDISKKVSLLEKYYSKVDKANDQNRPSGQAKNWITFQSKFRSTILEEFCYYLLKDIPEIKKLKLEFKKKKIHAGFEINSKGEIKPKKKDVDCCIVRAEHGRIGEKKIDLLIPVVAIECKTYLDGTMWNETQYSAILLKRVNSAARVYVLTEENRVKMSKITKESPVDDIFVIRTKDSSKIDANSVMEFVRQIRKDLQVLIGSNIVKIPGRLINF